MLEPAVLPGLCSPLVGKSASLPVKAVFFDLDSTIANTEHRSDVQGSKSHESWITYSRFCLGDTPIDGTVTALRIFYSQGFEIHLVSGRNAEAEPETRAWLAHHRIPFDFLRLRTADDIRNNALYKVAYILDQKERGTEAVLFFEDQLAVSETIQRETGVSVVTVRPWYEDKVGVAGNFTTSVAV
jgi:hypothetical protein